MPKYLARAHALLAKTPLVDGHNDLPYVIRIDKAAPGDVLAFDLCTARAGRDTDLARLQAGKVSAQFFAAFVPPAEKQPASYALQQIALIRRMNALHPDILHPALRAADILRAKREGKVASFTTIENGAALEGRLETLQTYYDLGVRLMTLCHNYTTDWCDSATDHPRHNGLTEFGRAAIAEMNRLGMMIDLAHVSDAVMQQVLDLSRAPVVWSHSNVRALCNHRRNVSDEVLARVAGNGGIVMATFVPDFISERSLRWMQPFRDEFGKTVERADRDAAIAAHEKTAGPWPRGSLPQYCDHLDALARHVGHDHIGIGSDFFGGPQGPGLEDASCFPGIFSELLKRGWNEINLRKLASENFTRVFKEVERTARRS